MFVRCVTIASLAMFANCTAASEPSDAPAASATTPACVRLDATSPQGVPLHPALRSDALSGRLADGVVVAIVERDASTGWLSIQAPSGVSGWISAKYAGDPAPCGSTPVAPPPAPPPAAKPKRYASAVIGAWNLEWFGGDKDRGFPESMWGGPSYPARTPVQIGKIAAKIRALAPAVLALEEIAGKLNPAGTQPSNESPALNALTAELGPSWRYELSSSGEQQRTALLYDTARVRLNASCVASIPTKRVDDKSLADRQPILGHFTLLSGGQPRNDFALVAVHFAAGDERVHNHDQAMNYLVGQIASWREAGKCLPSDEYDVVIAGDYNANPYDAFPESLWTTPGWRHLASADRKVYPPTRLSGVPLALHDSVIDHMLVTDGSGAMHGLWGEEITARVAKVHTEWVRDPAAFRENYSDHLPITVELAIGDDTD